MRMALTVHTCTCTQTQSTHTLLPPPLFWTHLMMMVREDPDLPPLSSSTCALVAVHMAVRLASPYRLLDHTWTLVYWHTSPWNNNQYNHKHNNIHKLAIKKQRTQSVNINIQNFEPLQTPHNLSQFYNGLVHQSDLPKNTYTLYIHSDKTPNSTWNRITRGQH